MVIIVLATVFYCVHRLLTSPEQIPIPQRPARRKRPSW